MITLPYVLATKYKRILEKGEQAKLFQKFNALRKLCISRGLPFTTAGVESLKKLHPELKGAIAEALKSRDALIFHNQRQVINMARQRAGWGVSEEDLISAGNTGLIEALYKYDPSKGSKFSAYAWWWIREKMRYPLRSATGITIPQEKFDKGGCKPIMTTFDTHPANELLPEESSLVDEMLAALSEEEAIEIIDHFNLDRSKVRLASNRNVTPILEKLKSAFVGGLLFACCLK